MNFKQYILKNFPDAKTSRLEKSNEVNIGCINPNCDDFWKNKKYKLGVNVKTGNFHCFRCNLRGRTKEEFLELMGDKELVDDSIEIKSFADIIDNLRNSINTKKEIINLKEPEHCLPASSSNRGISYLLKRNLTLSHILKYNILYSSDGEFKQRVIFPDYGLEGNLIFYQGRHIYDGKPKTLNVKVKRYNYIYNYYKVLEKYKDNNYVIIVEGIFDCLTIDNCCIALMTKHFTEEQFQMILELKKKKIYMFLDMDAQVEAIELCNRFHVVGIEVYNVVLPDRYNDPNDAGKIECFKAIKKAKKFNYKMLIKSKLD